MNIKDLKPSKQSRYKQGYINPGACHKLFEGLENTPIIYRSSYERTFIEWLESSPKVRHWGSETVRIPYYLVSDKKMHSYYPDYLVEFEDGTKMLIEIKPSNQTKKPLVKNSWAMNEWIKNMCKWRAAKEFCEARGYKFNIFTEKTIEML